MYRRKTKKHEITPISGNLLMLCIDMVIAYVAQRSDGNHNRLWYRLCVSESSKHCEWAPLLCMNNQTLFHADLYGDWTEHFNLSGDTLFRSVAYCTHLLTSTYFIVSMYWNYWKPFEYLHHMNRKETCIRWENFYLVKWYS